MELEYEIDNRDFTTTWLWIKKGPFDEAVYIEVNPKELMNNARENNPEEEYWNKSDRAYAGFLKDDGAKDERWFKFAGMALTAGIELDIPIEKIVEAIMETVHASDMETEVPHTYKEVCEEMKRWKEEGLE